MIGESGTRLPPGSPIVFVAPMAQGHMVLPWQDDGAAAAASATFGRFQRAGESLEFREHDVAGAAASYERAVAAARTSSERCAARVALGTPTIRS